MGKLIDVDDLRIALGMGVLCGNKTTIQLINEAPIVDAIPKDQYEARLKVDMVAMLTEIQLELDEMKITKVRSAGFAPYSKDPFRRGVNCSKEVIQQKIDSLKGAANDI